VQIRRGIHTREQKENVVRAVEAAPWRDLQETGQILGKPGGRRSPDAGSRAHADIDPAEAFGLTGSGLHQRKESAIHLAMMYGERKRNLVGQHFWARGCFVSTVGRDKAMMREYIRHQEEKDKRLEHMNLWR